VRKSLSKRHHSIHGRKVTLLLSTGVTALAAWSLSATNVAAQSTSGAAAGSQEVASNSQGDGIETVVVTARHREENAQNVPISLSVVNAATLDANGITSSRDLKELIPSLNVISTNPRNTTLLVRGLGSNVALTNDGLEGGVGVYVDGVLYTRPATSTFDLPDISSVEELRGPQGTLFGKNTVAGALNITTAAPSQTFEAYGDISYGNYYYEKETATVSGPLSETLAAGITAFNTSRDGFDYNVTTGGHPDDYYDNGARAQFVWQPADDFNLRVIADYSQQHENSVVNPLIGVVTTLADGQAVPDNFYQRAALAGYTLLPFDPFARKVDDNSPVYFKMEQGGLSAQADWAFDGGYSLTSISAVRYWNWNPSNDVDGTALSVLTEGRQGDQEREATQELRVTSPTGGPVEFTGGLFYFWESDLGSGRTSYGTDAPIWLLGANSPLLQAALNGFNIISQSTPIINSYAGYGQFTWHIQPKLDLTGGFRYTYETKTGGYSQISYGASLAGFTPTQQAQAIALRNAFGGFSIPYKIATNDKLLGGLATLTYHVNDQINTYATYSHGEKSAGLNLSNLPTLPTNELIVAPEEIDNYELGAKSTLFNDRVTLNADIFWDDDTNYQTTVSQLNLTPPVTYLTNIPSVRSRGLETDINLKPFDDLSWHFSSAYTEGSYVSYPNSPAPFEDYTVVGGKLVTTGTVNLSGRPLPLVSKWVLTTGGEYTRSLGFIGLANTTGYITADTTYQSSYYSTSNLSIYSLIPARDITNFSIGARTDEGHWDLSFWARNAFNTKYYITASAGGTGNSGVAAALLGDPQTFGATLRLSY
jgi:iron complex outermembrane receptor protein